MSPSSVLQYLALSKRLGARSYGGGSESKKTVRVGPLSGQVSICVLLADLREHVLPRTLSHQMSPVDSDMMSYSLHSMLTAAHITMYVVKARSSILLLVLGLML